MTEEELNSAKWESLLVTVLAMYLVDNSVKNNPIYQEISKIDQEINAIAPF